MLDPQVALAKVVPAMKAKADYLILLAYATKEESIELAQKFPDFNLVVTAEGGEEPPDRFTPIPGSKVQLVEVGKKGMSAIVIGIYDDARQPLRYQRVPLDSRFAASSDMKALMAAYQGQLQTLGLAGLGIRVQPHPQQKTNGRFVGSDKCLSCHEVSYAIWKKTPHFKAFQSLAQADPPRNFDPECVSCHVVGWHPTRFFPYASGYLSQEKTPNLVNVGCENCHGPGEEHVAAESVNDKVRQAKAQKDVRITKEESANPNSPKQHCYSCHDLDNSPDFDFNTYYPLIEHHEKE
jgi:hypothetical protein